MKLYRFRKNYERLHSETSDFLDNKFVRLANFSELNDVFEGRPAPCVLPSDDDYQKMRQVVIHLAQFAIDQQLKPDPIEITNSLLTEVRAVYDKYSGNPLEFVDIIRSHLRSASFTSELELDLMWAHYANGHRGWCFEYKCEHCLSRFSRDCIKQVEYLEERPKLTLGDCFSVLLFLRMHQAVLEAKPTKEHYEMSWMLLGQGLEAIAFFNVIKSITLSKSKSWSYEAEYRIVDYFSQSGQLEIGSLTLEGVVFGCLADESKIQEFKRRFGDSLTIRKMELCGETYTLIPR